MTACRETKKSGQPCGAAAGADGLCHFHRYPGEARRLGQEGGKRNRRHVLDPVELPERMSIAELRDKTLEVMRLVLRGEISSHEAIAFEHLSKQYERLWGVAEKLARLEILEQRFAESSKANGPRRPLDNQQQEVKLKNEAGEDAGDAHDAEDPELFCTGAKQFNEDS